VRVERASHEKIHFATSNLVAYPFGMSTATAKLLSEFEALPVEEKQEFVREVINHLPPWDSGPLTDDVAAAAGDGLAERLHEEECAS
jgi:hypothetical protein